MTIDQMLAEGWALNRMEREFRRRVFRRVLREEIKAHGESGAKGRAAKRLGIHRNTVTRTIWRQLGREFKGEQR